MKVEEKVIGVLTTFTVGSETTCSQMGGLKKKIASYSRTFLHFNLNIDNVDQSGQGTKAYSLNSQLGGFTTGLSIQSQSGGFNKG